MTFTSEKQNSINELKYQGLIKINRLPRINSNIVEGTDNNINAKFVLGSDPTNIQPIPMDGLKVQMQISNPIFASDFNYKSFIFAGKVKTSTFYKELFIAPYLEFTVNAGYIAGDYGPQHLFSPGTALGFFSPPGMLKGVNPYTFAGNGMIVLQAEHNWRSIPFQSLGLDFISDLFLDAITGVSVAKTWNESQYSIAPQQQKPYWEVYAGISRILGLFRVDVSYNSFKNFSVTASLGVIL